MTSDIFKIKMMASHCNQMSYFFYTLKWITYSSLLNNTFRDFSCLFLHYVFLTLALEASVLLMLSKWIICAACGMLMALNNQASMCKVTRSAFIPVLSSFSISNFSHKDLYVFVVSLCGKRKTVLADEHSGSMLLGN